MLAIGEKSVTKESVQNQVLKKWPNMNFMSIFTAFYVPSTGYSSVESIYSVNDTDPGDLI